MTERPDWRWQDDAACVRHPHIDWTIDNTEHVSRDQVAETREAAARICATCPVRNWCATEAETCRTDPGDVIRPVGVHAGRLYDGTRTKPADILQLHDLHELAAAAVPDKVIAARLGMTHAQVVIARRKLGIHGKTPRTQPQGPVPTHGTRSGYQAHRRRDEDPCYDCLEGKRAEDRDRGMRLRAAQRAAQRDQRDVA